MGSYVAAPPQEAGLADHSLPAIAVSTDVYLLVFDGARQPFHQDVFVAALNSLPNDLDLLGLQPGHDVS